MPKLLTPLVAVKVASIYQSAPLPERMARATPDMAAALEHVVRDLQALGHDLRLSDMFRSYEMQWQAHQDYATRKKKAYSPPPGGSMHEGGRAMDIDLSSMGVPLSRFWEIAKAHGFLPIIDKPESSRSEAWHFDCRGSHAAVYEYVRSGKAGAVMRAVHADGRERHRVDRHPTRRCARSGRRVVAVLADPCRPQPRPYRRRDGRPHARRAQGCRRRGRGPRGRVVRSIKGEIPPGIL